MFNILLEKQHIHIILDVMDVEVTIISHFMGLAYLILLTNGGGGGNWRSYLSIVARFKYFIWGLKATLGMWPFSDPFLDRL